MIDFRYHLVSLISVFLALAVGIVLGAGPLRDDLGDQLSGQVEQLRTEQEELRAQADQLEGRNDQLAGFVSGVAPELVAGTLPGRDVAVLTDDPSTSGSADAVVTLLEEAGVRSAPRIVLEDALWSPDQVDRRSEALDRIRAIAPAVLDPDLEPSAQLAGVLGILLADGGPTGFTPDLREQVWQVLTDQQLVTLDGDAPAPVDAVVYATAEAARFEVPSDDGTLAAERAQGMLGAQTSLLDALAAAELPTVVAGVTPANDATTGLLRTVRGDARYGDLSTTDRLQEADGPVLAVLALVEQVDGGAGSYGTTTDAEARLPDLPDGPVGADVQDPAGEGSGDGDGPAASDGGEG